MPQTLRKLIGIFLLVALVVVYALVATAIASARLADASWWVHAIYFLFTGLLWIVPGMFVVNWMLKPDRSDSQ